MVNQIEKLFERQARTWPLLAEGLKGLARAETRRLRIGRFDVFVRHIPHRVGSTTAPVDPVSVAKRRCFLCDENLPPEEEGVRFDENFTIYCNPFPIVDRHLTISHAEHRAQRIADSLGAMLDLAAALAGYFVIYNGPECGASAPDHMHFQAGARTLLPIEKDTAGMRGPTVPHYVRNVLLLRGSERSALIDRMNHAIELLAQATGRRTEPLLNLAVFREGGEWVAYLFPRRKHRPQVFYTGELTVSPASIDLCGIFVVPLADDFRRITGDAIASVFREITLPDPEFREVAARLEGER
jgi:hypothetical protein